MPFTKHSTKMSISPRWDCLRLVWLACVPGHPPVGTVTNIVQMQRTPRMKICTAQPQLTQQQRLMLPPGSLDLAQFLVGPESSHPSACLLCPGCTMSMCTRLSLTFV